MKKKIFLTGGGGYIGSVLTRKLLEKGYDVLVFDKFIFGKEPIAEIKKDIEIIKGDIRKIPNHLLNDIHAIIHLAGFSTDPTSQYDPRLTDLINHISTENLAKKARQKGIKRFIYASTCSVYFTLNTPLTPPLYKEDDLINPISAYSLTKRCSEQVLWGMTGKDFQPTIFRKGTLYGYSPRMRYDLVFNSFVKDAFTKKIMTVDAGGEIWRPMIDIQDACNAYIKSIELPLSKVGGMTFNIADKNWRIGDLAEEIKKILEKKGFKVELDIKPYGLTRNYKADTKLFKSTFKFKRQRSLSQALDEIWNQLENYKGDLNSSIFYGDRWYKDYFQTKEGIKYRRYV